MYNRVLQRLRGKIRAREYVVTTHADEEMFEDHFTAADVESAILDGEIVEKQREHHSGEWKFVVHGRSLSGRPMAVVTKIGHTGKLVIITVYCL